MKILGLDLSTHIGYSVLCSEKGLLEHGTFDIPRQGHSSEQPMDYAFYKNAEIAAAFAHKMYIENKPDFIYIEQTNAGSNRFSQKQLEFIHCMILAWGEANLPEKIIEKIRYVDTSAWRAHLKIRLSKEQSKHNKAVREARKKGQKIVGGVTRGKITSKHLAVWWSNQTFGLKLKLKDNDAADAIAVAHYGLNKESTPTVKITPEELFTKAFVK
jgi:hypothetical protein